MNAHYYSVLTTPFDMVNAHYVIIDFRAKFFIKIQNQASDTSRSLPSFSSAPFLLRAVPSERLGQVYRYQGFWLLQAILSRWWLKALFTLCRIAFCSGAKKHLVRYGMYNFQKLSETTSLRCNNSSENSVPKA